MRYFTGDVRDRKLLTMDMRITNYIAHPAALKNNC